MVLFNRGQGSGGGYWQEYADTERSENKSEPRKAVSTNASVVEKSTHQIPSIANRKRNSEIPAITMARTM